MNGLDSHLTQDYQWLYMLKGRTNPNAINATMNNLTTYGPQTNNKSVARAFN